MKFNKKMVLGAFGCLLAGMLATPVHAQYTLQWGDDFNGAANAPANPANWTYQLGNSSATARSIGEQLPTAISTAMVILLFHS